MSEVTQSSVKGILVAAVVGAAVGAGIAILFAPCSGKETRGWLMHKTREIKERTTSAIEHGKDAARRAMREIRRDGELAATGAERPVYSETGAAAKTA